MIDDDFVDDDLAPPRGPAARGTPAEGRRLERRRRRRSRRALLGVELRLTLRRGESLLLTLGIPVGLLVFFSLVDVLPTESALDRGDDPVQILAPGILALAIVSTAMTGLAISTGFERSYGVLKRLGTAPLRRRTLLEAKIGAVVVVELLQAAILIPVGIALGWEPSLEPLPLVGAVILGTTAFAGLGLFLAGTLRAEITLALANGLYVALLLLGGFIIPLGELPGALRAVAEVLPAARLTNLVVDGFGGDASSAADWLVLAGWAVILPTLAASTFRWTPD